MSSFICNQKTFNNIYSGLQVYGLSNLYQYDTINRATQKALDNTGQSTIEQLTTHLHRLNVQAVTQRYPNIKENELPGPIDNPDQLKPLQLNPGISIYTWSKALSCLSYQMAEGNIPNTQGYKQLEAIIQATHYSIVTNTPEYEAAPWD